MVRCQLETGQQRQVYVCNYNQHYMEKHLDRIRTFHDLFYVYEGEWEVWQDQEPYQLKEGDMILLGAHHHHYGIKPCTKKVKTMYIHFECLDADLCGEELVHREKMHDFPMHFHVPADSQILFLMENIYSAYWEKTAYSAEKASAFLSLLLCEISLVKSGNEMHLTTEELVNRLRRTIASNPNHFYSVDELCELIHVSRKTLNNYFIDVLGLPPHTYQLKRKLTHAKNRLEQYPYISVEELAADYGFCDQYHFSKQFKKEFGISPKQFVKEYQRSLPDNKS